MSQTKTKVVLAFSDMNAKEYVDKNKHNCVYFDYVSWMGINEKVFINEIKYNIWRSSIDYIFVDLDPRILERLMSEKIDFYLLFPFVGEGDYFLEKYNTTDMIGHHAEYLYIQWYLINKSSALDRYRSAEKFKPTCRYIEYSDYNCNITSLMPRILLHKRITDTASN